jgi:hypothetical protein
MSLDDFKKWVGETAERIKSAIPSLMFGEVEAALVTMATQLFNNTQTIFIGGEKVFLLENNSIVVIDRAIFFQHIDGEGNVPTGQSFDAFNSNQIAALNSYYQKISEDAVSYLRTVLMGKLSTKYAEDDQDPLTELVTSWSRAVVFWIAIGGDRPLSFVGPQGETLFFDPSITLEDNQEMEAALSFAFAEDRPSPLQDGNGEEALTVITRMLSN